MTDNNHDKHDHKDHDPSQDFDNSDTIILTLDDDTEVECGVIGLFEVDGNDYISLLSFESDQILIYRYLDSEDLSSDEFNLEVIEDDDEFQLVSDAFYDLYVGDEEGEDLAEEDME